MNRVALCAAVIPACDEAATIAAVVTQVRRHLPETIVVDDGSRDLTAARAREAGARVISHPGNRGKGAALKTGLASAWDRRLSWAMTLDGDGQHLAEDIPAFFRCAEASGAALVVGNRMENAARMPWLRRTVNRWMSRRLSARAGCALPDTQCGFRLVDLRAWTALSFRTDHYELESESLLEFVRAGYRVEFVPIQVVGRGPRSHIHRAADTWRWLRWWRQSRPGRERAAGAPAGFAPANSFRGPGGGS